MVGLSDFTPPFQCKLLNYSNGRKQFNPYWTCSHSCVYCYAKNGWRWKYWGKKSETPVSVDIGRAIKDYTKLSPMTEIEASSSSDPFDLRFERKYGVTRSFLEALKDHLRDDIFFTFITKSGLIKEYGDLIPPSQSVIQMTVENYKNKLALSSPKASPYEERLNAVRTLIEIGFNVSIRIDPIIPFFLEDESIPLIINDFTSVGIKHITISFLKVFDFQISSLSSVIARDLKPLLTPSKEHPKEYFVKDEIRKPICKKIKDQCEALGLTFSMCRETICSETGLCDPFHLLPSYKPKQKPIIYKTLEAFK